MARFPDKFIVMQPVGNIDDPYNPPEYKMLYSGKCRCYLRKPTATRIGTVKDSDFRIVVPDRSMPDVGENFRVCVKMHTNKNNRFWDHVGYVSDFARYDRNCEIDFNMVKENVIYEDMPSSVIDQEKRVLTTVEYDGFVLEGVSVTRDRIVLACGEPITLGISVDKTEFEQFNWYICRKGSDGQMHVVDVEHLDYRNNGYVGLVYIPKYEEVLMKDDEGFDVEDEDATNLSNTYYMAVFLNKDDEDDLMLTEDGYVLARDPDFMLEYYVTGE